MKKSVKYSILSIILAVTALTFSSCYSPIFYGIMNDVPPEKATVSGNITTIARCLVDGTEYLFLNGNGSLMYKKLDEDKHGAWKNYTALPFELHHYNYYYSASAKDGHVGQQVLRVIADKDNIYLLTVAYETNTEYGIVLPKKFYLWTRPLNGILEGKAADWKDLAENADASVFPTKKNTAEGSFETYFNLIYTNSPSPNHRKAILRATNPDTSEDSYYVLNGSTALTKDSSIGTSNYIATDDDKKNTRVNSLFYLGDTLYYSDSQVVCTNETKDTAATYACMSSSDKNYNSTKKLYLFEGNASSMSFIVEGSSAIASLAITADSVIIGEGSYNASYTSNGGIQRVELDSSSKPKKELVKFTNNAEYQFTSAYIVMSLLCADPSKTEAQASMYATITYRGAGTSSSATPANIGLWSYYSSRGNWNRE
ncbi:MAG: hypothetical protein J5726_05935 [Treponema sp.]|nr:hypothetical protein [Treponema sp.]